MSRLSDCLKEKDGLVFIGHIDKDTVDDAENALGIQFAEDYRDYIANYGCASFVGHELTGICNSERLNVVSATKRNHQYFPGIPSDLYVIEETNIDDIVIWQDRSGSIYRTVSGRDLEKVYDSLTDYISNEKG